MEGRPHNIGVQYNNVGMRTVILCGNTKSQYMVQLELVGRFVDPSISGLLDVRDMVGGKIKCAREEIKCAVRKEARGKKIKCAVRK